MFKKTQIREDKVNFNIRGKVANKYFHHAAHRAHYGGGGFQFF
jgi:hypothetical protein